MQVDRPQETDVAPLDPLDAAARRKRAKDKLKARLTSAPKTQRVGDDEAGLAPSWHMPVATAAPPVALEEAMRFAQATAMPTTRGALAPAAGVLDRQGIAKPNAPPPQAVSLRAALEKKQGSNITISPLDRHIRHYMQMYQELERQCELERNKALHPDYVRRDGEAGFKLRLEGAPREVQSALKALDTDGDSSISLDEILQTAMETQALKWKTLFLALCLLVLTLGGFCTTLAAASLAQPTDSQGGCLVAGGEGGEIMATAGAEEEVALALMPLLSVGQLQHVKEVTIGSLSMVNSNRTGTSEFVSIEALVIQVDVAIKVEGDTQVTFLRTNGIQVTVIKGVVSVMNLPGMPGKTFLGCGKATCSAVKVHGVDLASLKVRATALGFSNIGERRGVAKWVHAHHEKAICGAAVAGVAGSGLLVLGLPRNTKGNDPNFTEEKAKDYAAGEEKEAVAPAKAEKRGESDAKKEGSTKPEVKPAGKG